MPLRSFHTTIAITLFLFLIISVASVAGGGASAVGDGGMRRDELRVAFEAWNFCNEVGAEAPAMGSPRAADCFDLTQDTSSIVHKVSEADNRLGVGTPFPGLKPEALNNPDLYAAEKELYLGSLCQVSDSPTPWQFWMVMLKNGNYDARSGLCPENGKKAPPFKPGRFPCFGTGCMNQPSLCHQPTALHHHATFMRGGFNGTYDTTSNSTNTASSYFEVVWEKKLGSGSWVFNHKLRTSSNYPWLMLYLRADATKGYSGGYHYDTRGMLKIVRILIFLFFSMSIMRWLRCYVSESISGKIRCHTQTRIFSRAMMTHVTCIDETAAGVSEFQGETEFGHQERGRSEEPVLLDRHRELLEKQRRPLRRRRGDRRHSLLGDDHQPSNCGVVQPHRHRQLPPLPHHSRRHQDTQKRHCEFPLRRLSLLLRPRQRAAPREAIQHLRSLQQSASAGARAVASSSHLGRLRLPYQAGRRVGGRRAYLGARRRRPFWQALLLSGSRYCTCKKNMDLS
ncbi:uncharacterized protein LOC130995426 isoform X1 [Salvia miltiorrhiza]|uniref:uncharacterized protein LOC130995426 isoform X1 n=1 Tax=Salvia miltiorrhiza TaxID=226208 RepID=UPI0025AD2CC0|nr:uncharacterized protein LOC130995426 isoform X1 [Salvia miltiorrhiza]